MKVCLLSHHPQLFTQQRFVVEGQALGVDVTVLHPEDTCWVWPNISPHFDVTFNRLTAVDSGAFEMSLSLLPHWGKQVNPWELRQSLWDKSRQVMWLHQFGLTAPASFMHRGSLAPDNPQWQDFSRSFADKGGWVLKFNRGQRGVGVNFIADEAGLFAWLETLHRMGDQDFIIQPRLMNALEYRLTLLNGRPWALLRREGERANYAQGGKAQELAPQEWPSSIKDICERLRGLDAGTYLSLDILLVDNKAVVLDVNTSPGVEQLEAVTGRNFIGDLLQQTVNSL